MSRTSARAVLYVRLSRDTAASTSIRGQNDELYARAEAEGWDVVATFEDNGRSGGKQRANAQEALAMISDGRADVLVVYAYDRWSRMGIADSADVINTIYARANTSNPARFVAMREGIDSDREGWELLTAFTADIAQKERQRMVQRRTAAIGRMRQEGRNPGNGPAPFGYRSAPFDDGRPGKRLVVDPEEALLIREVADRLVAGASTTSVARDLTRRGVPMPRSDYRLAQLAGTDRTGLATGTWNSSRVSQIWQSDHLLGRVRVRTSRAAGGKSNGELLLDPETGLPATPFEPILDVETFDRLKARFAPGAPRKRRGAALLSGLAFCGLCGHPMYPITDGEKRYYRCSGKTRGFECTSPRILASKLEELVLADYRSKYGRRPAFDVVERAGSPEVTRERILVAEQIAALGRQVASETDESLVDGLIARLRTLRLRRAELDALPVEMTTERIYTGQTIADRFDATEDLAERRALLGAAYGHVEVLRRADEARLGYRVRFLTTLDYAYADDPVDLDPRQN